MGGKQIWLFGLIILVVSGCVQGEKEEVPSKAGIPIPVGINLPKEDVIGEDLEDVPRYSPSVRISYDKDTYGNALFVDIEYYTEDALSKVREFYLTEMPKHGWKAVAEEAQPGVSLPFGGVSVGESRTIDFRKQDCKDPSTCLPYAKITLGGFKVGEEQYTFISINYEERAEGAQPETGEAPPETEANVAGIASAVDTWIRPALEGASGGKVKLGDYVVERVTELSGVTLNYDLPQGVVDETTLMVDPKLHLRVADELEAKPEVEVVQAYELVENNIYVVEVAGPLRIDGEQVAFVKVSIPVTQPLAMVEVKLPTQVDFGSAVIEEVKSRVEPGLEKVSHGYGKTLKLVSLRETGYLTDGGMSKAYAAWLVYDVGDEKVARSLCEKWIEGWMSIENLEDCMKKSSFEMEHNGEPLSVEVREVIKEPSRVVVAVHARTRGMGMPPGIGFPFPGGG